MWALLLASQSWRTRAPLLLKGAPGVPRSCRMDRPQRQLRLSFSIVQRLMMVGATGIEPVTPTMSR
jgi:hypothetical protein